MSSTYLDLNALNGAMKELYDDQKVQDMVYRDNPFFALVPKNTDFLGKYKPVPIIIGTSQGRSATFASAQGNQAAAVIKEFLLTRVSDYSIATIDRQTMLASATDKGAFVAGAKVLMDSAIRALENSIASAMFRSGTGSIGQIGSITSGVITLADPNQVVQFEINQTLQANATDGGTPRAAVGYVVAVSRDSGTVTVSGSMGGSAASPSGWTANDFLLVSGDNNLKMSGLAAWLPTSDPQTGDNFYGVDRSVDPTRLAGVRYDGSAESIEEALIDASTLLSREGGRPNYCIMSTTSYAALVKALGSKVQFVDLKQGEIGFRGVIINGASGPINVFADRNCPPKTAYLLTLSSWSFDSLGEAPQIQRENVEGDMLRMATADAAEVRISMYGNLSCNAPGWNAYVKLGS